jgi:hypothetical protein
VVGGASFFWSSFSEGRVLGVRGAFLGIAIGLIGGVLAVFGMQRGGMAFIVKFGIMNPSQTTQKSILSWLLAIAGGLGILGLNFLAEFLFQKISTAFL